MTSSALYSHGPDAEVEEIERFTIVVCTCVSEAKFDRIQGRNKLIELEILTSFSAQVIDRTQDAVAHVALMAIMKCSPSAAAPHLYLFTTSG